MTSGPGAAGGAAEARVAVGIGAMVAAAAEGGAAGTAVDTDPRGLDNFSPKVHPVSIKIKTAKIYLRIFPFLS